MCITLRVFLKFRLSGIVGKIISELWPRFQGRCANHFSFRKELYWRKSFLFLWVTRHTVVGKEIFNAKQAPNNAIFIQYQWCDSRYGQNELSIRSGKIKSNFLQFLVALAAKGCHFWVDITPLFFYDGTAVWTIQAIVFQLQQTHQSPWYTLRRTKTCLNKVFRYVVLWFPLDFWLFCCNRNEIFALLQFPRKSA